MKEIVFHIARGLRRTPLPMKINEVKPCNSIAIFDCFSNLAAKTFVRVRRGTTESVAAYNGKIHKRPKCFYENHHQKRPSCTSHRSFNH